MTNQVTMYDVIFTSGGVAKEVPLRNKPIALCKWWVSENKSRYTNGELVIVETFNNKKN